jgi:hypothetical protein
LNEPQPERTTHKFAIILNRKIESGTALNACAHMTATLVARADSETTKHMSFVDYLDADGNVHPVSALSLVVLSARNANQIRTARLEAIRAGLPCADFTESMTKDTFVEQMDRTRSADDLLTPAIPRRTPAPRREPRPHSGSSPSRHPPAQARDFHALATTSRMQWLMTVLADGDELHSCDNDLLPP